MILRIIFISLCLASVAHTPSRGQTSVVGLLKSNLRQSLQLYDAGDYENALKHFALVKETKIDPETRLKIARSLFFVRRYSDAARAYSTLRKNGSLDSADLIHCAATNTSVGNYSEALSCYKDILAINPDDNTILRKIWQLSNVYLLFEDSLHYTVRRVPFNTRAGEAASVPYRNGVAFLSDRKEIDFGNPDVDATRSDFGLYYTEAFSDTTRAGLDKGFRAPVNIGRSLTKIEGIGPTAFYANNNKCVFTAPAEAASSSGPVKTQLYFTEQIRGKWTVPAKFVHNDPEYNLTEPSVSPDGLTLVFSSDKPGGYGGFDLYLSRWTGDSWSTPENLGDQINTRGNESFPFTHHNTLYFSSDGHAGLGGTDIFSTILAHESDREVHNLGYPVNSGADDFAFVLSTTSQGYFSSNRKREGFDDDIYEFEMDFRTYPFDISGTVRISDTADSTDRQPMAGALVELMDYPRSQVVGKTCADVNGDFSLSIPWFSKFALRISEDDDEPYLVSLEINRDSNESPVYEIVVIKRLSHGTPKSTSESN